MFFFNVVYRASCLSEADCRPEKCWLVRAGLLANHQFNLNFVESLQSHCIHAMSLVQWTTRLLPVMRGPGTIPRGGTYVKLGFSC
jgi:hypothetical protein